MCNFELQGCLNYGFLKKFPLPMPHSGIKDFGMGQVSGMEISSPPKISPREEKLASQGP